MSDSYCNEQPGGMYEVAFHRWLVREIEEERMSVPEAVERFHFNPENGRTLLYGWRQKYAPKMVLALLIMTEEERQQLEALQERLRQTEQQLQDAQRKNIALEALIDVAENHLKLSIQKSLVPNSNLPATGVPPWGIPYLCSLFGKTRQAYYHHLKSPDNAGLQEALVLKLVAKIRQQLPRFGTGKLQFMLQDGFQAHGIKMSRDALYDLLGSRGLLIPYRRRKPYTTNAIHPYHKYPNLIRDLTLTAPGQLWVSDITYIVLSEGRFAYLSLNTDAYSHLTVGYKLHPTAQPGGGGCPADGSKG